MQAIYILWYFMPIKKFWLHESRKFPEGRIGGGENGDNYTWITIKKEKEKIYIHTTTLFWNGDWGGVIRFKVILYIT